MENHGSGILGYYQGSLQLALRSVYPEMNWIPWKFTSVPHRYWETVENRHFFFIHVAQDVFKIRSLEEWYGVSVEDIYKHGGGHMLATYYNSSLINALREIYSHYSWYEWRFSKVPAGTYKNQEFIQKYLDYLARKMNIKVFSDWYRVNTLSVLRGGGGDSILKKNKGLPNILSWLFPYFPWNIKKFLSKGKKSSQRELLLKILVLFPHNLVLEDFVNPCLIFSSSCLPMRLDLWVPELKLAFEYQGIQHYQHLPFFGNLLEYQRRDEEKLFVCQKNNILLIRIPYWWNGCLASLKQILELHGFYI
eukprot:TRINITY_DN4047_c0_g4_i1.p1 TRINITY_DN4047_c0_g4~~TRINITY_DN4047_c0_g4_i1.p1  ORF type:complete len:306 (-),score=60.62 TRINITY_DN4047_c0_g4_i1:95-1012(-)